MTELRRLMRPRYQSEAADRALRRLGRTYYEDEEICPEVGDLIVRGGDYIIPSVTEAVVVSIERTTWRHLWVGYTDAPAVRLRDRRRSPPVFHFEQLWSMLYHYGWRVLR